MNLKTKFVRLMAGGHAARIWHRFAPSFMVKRQFGNLKIHLDFRDNFDALFTSQKDFLKREWPVMELPAWINGLVWDVGANAGYVTLRSAANGNQTVAFELSSRAVELLKKSRAVNKLDFEIVPRAFLTSEVHYEAPKTSRSGNRIQTTNPGNETSITFQEAEKLYGVPKLIKMDIEGSEKEFFASAEWKEWICKNNILWVVEVHHSVLGFTPIWDDVPYILLPTGHFAYQISESGLASLVKYFFLNASVVKHQSS